MKNPVLRFLIVAIVTLASQAPLALADPYHRFWRGTKLNSLSADGFQSGLNQVFIAKTVQAAGEKGLIAYEPVLTEGAAPNLPDEIALVSYQDEASYNAIRSTPEGQAYGALHWQYFDKAHSGSMVPESYAGSVAVEHAYDLHPAFSNWKGGNTRVLIQFRNSGEDDATYLARVKNYMDQASTDDAKNAVEGRVCLVASGYWIEYVSRKTLTRQMTMNPIVTDFSQYSKGKALSLPVEKKPVDKAALKPGHGVNVQF